MNIFIRIFLTNGQTMVPPIVDALLELQALIVNYLFGIRRIRERPGTQIDQHDQQDGHHPLKQLFVGQLNLVRRLDSVGQRDPESDK